MESALTKVLWGVAIVLIGMIFNGISTTYSIDQMTPFAQLVSPSPLSALMRFVSDFMA